MDDPELVLVEFRRGTGYPMRAVHSVTKLNGGFPEAPTM